jgi:CheY-like chemotaxis protein
VHTDIDGGTAPIAGDSAVVGRIVDVAVLHALSVLARGSEADRRLSWQGRSTRDFAVLMLDVSASGLSCARAVHETRAQENVPSRPLSTTSSDLAEAHALAMGLGGELWLEDSEKGRPVIGLRFPLASRSWAVVHGPPADSGSVPRHLHVLVADDEPSLRLVLRLTLENRGHRVSEAASVQEAIGLIQSRSFDVVLVDVRMPGDGLALIERLSDGGPLHGRTLLVSGDVSRPATRRLIDRGHPYIRKPFCFEELVGTVESLGG